MKNYARIFNGIFVNAEETDNGQLNENAKFVETMQGLLESLYWLEQEGFENFIAENKTLKDFADYIRENADAIADSTMAMAYRKMRHPSRSKDLREFCKKGND